ncbi:DUF6636 domain-containing protein [Ruegeria sp. HKCCD6157]|jgi:hypothetical protein|uniref:DUF6636 domain-containing protein n=1 Tax=Ruegeria sp. HKCCD6157 TaxID=2690707 RepID=UPI001491074A|nr:DUF6636 domain-containing protein [Ruegeria sp. HKCCD6157]NOE26089.1 hypothetical protein [Ruegeria sp. HKCCD6157]
MFRFFLGAVIFCASPAVADVWTFETPSENIQCSVGESADSSDIQCTIIEKYGPPAMPRPANCQTDWGHDFLMFDTGPVELLCQPLNRSRDGFDRAEYGVTGRFGGFTCTSSTKGLECRNLDGHGFFLSRAVQQVF